MNSFTDYYAVLGVEVDAPPDVIKAAFKKLALKYHPDVYKGEDAHERMRVLLQAYQTLNDPQTRKQYDAQRSEFMPHSSRPKYMSGGVKRAASSPQGRNGGQRFAFPDLTSKQRASIELEHITYTLSTDEATTLLQQGMLRGLMPYASAQSYYCHRCRHRWPVRPEQKAPQFCPHCRATDWQEYLLLRCLHCHVVFESEQIRYEIGGISYDKRRTSGRDRLCPPYELFPLCPHCHRSHWCPSEESRVDELRQRAARRFDLKRLLLPWL